MSFEKCRMSLMTLSRSMSLSKSGCSSTMSNWMSLMDGPPDEDKRTRSLKGSVISPSPPEVIVSDSTVTVDVMEDWKDEIKQ